MVAREAQCHKALVEARRFSIGPGQAKHCVTSGNVVITQVSYRFLALGCFPANLVSDEKEQKNRR